MNDKFEIEWLLEQISPRGNKETLRSVKPKDGVASFVWRMIRFDSGIDMHFPVNCFIYLANQMEADKKFKHFKIGAFGPEEKHVLDKLDKLIMECSSRLGLDTTVTARKMKGILY